MTTQTLATRPSDPSIPYPALHHDGDHTWKPESRIGGIAVGALLSVAFIGASIWLQLISDVQYEVTFNKIVTIPAVLFTGVGAVVSLIVLAAAFRPHAPWFQDWSYLEVLEEQDGLRIFAGRLGKDHEGVLVRSGESVQIAGSRGEELDEAELTVKAPAGSLTVDVDVFLSTIDAKPLAAAAERYGITLVYTGVATEIPAATA